MLWNIIELHYNSSKVVARTASKIIKLLILSHFGN
jgi:hypothetical protein